MEGRCRPDGFYPFFGILFAYSLRSRHAMLRMYLLYEPMLSCLYCAILSPTEGTNFEVEKRHIYHQAAHSLKPCQKMQRPEAQEVDMNIHFG